MGNSSTKQKLKKQQNQKHNQPPIESVTITINPEIKPEDPQIFPQVSEKQSFKARYEKIESWNSENPAQLLDFTEGSGFANTIYLAYNKHYNLQLSPDDIWLAILQGFSCHLEVNHKKLRHKFVDFDSKKELIIVRNNFKSGKKSNDWQGCFKEWGQQIKENLGENNFSNLMPSFTSTTQISQACFNVSLMDSMKHYFSFGCCTLCGIPQVKLTGSLQDWQKLREMAQIIGQEYELDWWMDKLVPILDKFIEAYEKKTVDKVFWNCIYKIVPPMGSGGVKKVNGWIVNFFPYKRVNDIFKGELQKNDCLKSLDEIYEKYEKFCYNDLGGFMNYDSLPKGVTETPFEWQYGSKKRKMNIIAGFHNVAFEDDGFIKPAKGWAIGKGEKI